jgi:hypothetical protein
MLEGHPNPGSLKSPTTARSPTATRRNHSKGGGRLKGTHSRSKKVAAVPTSICQEAAATAENKRPLHTRIQEGRRQETRDQR